MAAGLFIATGLLFSRVLGYGFLNYDDPTYVTANPQVQSGLSWHGLVWALTAPTDYWHPLTWLSHMLDWQLYGPSAGGHHVTSVLWHALNAVLAFFLFRRLAGGFWRSAFAAALFAWHPLRVESVVWITERKDVMSGCFFFLTLLAYLRYAEARVAGRTAWPNYLSALVCFLAGLMSKPMLVTLPVVLLILDGWPLNRIASRESVWPLLREKIPFFLLAGVDAVLTVHMQRNLGAFVLHMPFTARAENALVSLVRYLAKFVWPFDLVVCYRHPGFWPLSKVLAAAALLLAIAILAFQQRRTRPWIAAGFAWFLVTLLPVLGLMQVGFQSMADRYTYLPLLGIEWAVIWSVPIFSSKIGRTVASAGAVVLLASCSLRTWNQEGYWASSISLFTHAVECSKENEMAESFLASAYFAGGKFDQAGIHAERAYQLNSRNDQVLITLAGVRERQGRDEEAERLYRQALELRPGDTALEGQLGLLELGHGRTGEARALLIKALRNNPELRDRTLELGRNAIRDGHPSTALFLFEVVLAVDPENSAAEAWSGAALLASNDPLAALDRLRRAVARAPDLADAQLTLARCAEQLGLTTEASDALKRAVNAAPRNTNILCGVAEVYAHRGDFSDALPLCRKAVDLAPSDGQARVLLGYLLIGAGQRADGIAEWRRALQLDPHLPGLRERLQQVEAEGR